MTLGRNARLDHVHIGRIGTALRQSHCTWSSDGRLGDRRRVANEVHVVRVGAQAAFGQRKHDGARQVRFVARVLSDAVGALNQPSQQQQQWHRSQAAQQALWLERFAADVRQVQATHTGSQGVRTPSITRHGLLRAVRPCCSSSRETSTTPNLPLSLGSAAGPLFHGRVRSALANSIGNFRNEVSDSAAKRSRSRTKACQFSL